MANFNETPDADQSDSQNQRVGPGLLQVAWQRKSLVILGIMLGLVLGLLFYAQKQPIYQSQASLLVVKKTPDQAMNLGGTDNRIAYMEDYMSTQSIIIRSPRIVNSAAKQPNLQDLKSFPGERPENIGGAIRENLFVGRDTREAANPNSNNNIMTLQFRGPEADECMRILEAVIKSYQQFLDETYKNVSDRTLELIMLAQQTLKDTLDRADQDYQEFRLKNPFVLGRSENSQNIYLTRLNKIEARRADLRIEKAEMTDKLAQFKELKDKKGRGAAMQWISMVGLKFAFEANRSEADREIIRLEVQKKRLLQVVGLKHPDVVAIDEMIGIWRDSYGSTSSPKPDIKTGSDSEKPVKTDNLETYADAMEAKISDCDMLLKSLDEMYEIEQKQAREVSNYEATDERLRRKIQTSQTLFDSIVKRVSELGLTKDFGGYEAQQIAQPIYGKKVSPNPYSVFPIAGFGGLLVGLCLAYLAELSDKSFRTPAEIRRRLGLPVVGHIPFFAPDENAAKQIAAGEPAVEPMLCTHYASNSVSSEAYRSVRTALYFNSQGVGHQVIQVTSPNMADGKSTLCANLAVSIAQSGKKTIVIDADCRRPRMHKILNVPNDIGLASVIAGQSDLASSIRPTAIPNLSVLPCGPRPANPAELLTSPRFKELLDIIRAQFDFVLVDTPPLLVVTDPCVVAPRVDGVILAIRVTKNGRPFAERAKEILASLGANVIGVVVNGLGGQSGSKYGYGYDSYNYGYGYNYTYRYSYTYTDDYTDDKASSYYSAPDHPEMPHHQPASSISEQPAGDVPPVAPALEPRVEAVAPPAAVNYEESYYDAPPRSPGNTDDEESFPAS